MTWNRVAICRVIRCTWDIAHLNAKVCYISSGDTPQLPQMLNLPIFVRILMGMRPKNILSQCMRDEFPSKYLNHCSWRSWLTTVKKNYTCSSADVPGKTDRRYKSHVDDEVHLDVGRDFQILSVFRYRLLFEEFMADCFGIVWAFFSFWTWFTWMF